MKTKIDELKAQLETAEYHAKRQAENVETAREAYQAALNEAHTWTAADYRIVLSNDPYSNSFEDIVGELLNEEEDVSEEYRARYQALYDAYHGSDARDGVYALVVTLQKRNLETGSFKDVESLGGLFHLWDDPQARIFDEARDIISGSIDADGIDMSQVQVVDGDAL